MNFADGAKHTGLDHFIGSAAVKWGRGDGDCPVPLASVPSTVTLDPMPKTNSSRQSKRGRKPILTPAQKASVMRMVRHAFKTKLRRWAKQGPAAGKGRG